ncbi:MAG: GbsR/MarR family transcriptional regulator [Planctomycetota bacterium]
MIDLTPTMKKFVLHWGEMGSRWGINRTVAQVHALLYISPEPLNAEDITETLSVARSNVSTSLRELLTWGIVRTVPVLGDRRTHYKSLADVWELFRIVVQERKQRELDPTFVTVRECLEESGRATAADKHFRERLGALLEFFEAISAWYADMDKLPTRTARRLIKLGGKVQKMLGFTSR